MSIASEREKAFLEAHGYFRGRLLKTMIINPLVPLALTGLGEFRSQRFMICTGLDLKAEDTTNTLLHPEYYVQRLLRIGSKLFGDDLQVYVGVLPPPTTIGLPGSFPMELLEPIQPQEAMELSLANVSAVNLSVAIKFTGVEYDQQILYSGLSLYDILMHAKEISR